jgi:hypothetical protein
MAPIVWAIQSLIELDHGARDPMWLRMMPCPNTVGPATILIWNLLLWDLEQIRSAQAARHRSSASL